MPIEALVLLPQISIVFSHGLTHQQGVQLISHVDFESIRFSWSLVWSVGYCFGEQSVTCLR